MKSICALSIFYFFSVYNLNSQINSILLEHNNVSATISDLGTYFRDVESDEMGYEVPKESGLHTIYSTQFWFAGKDQLDSLHFVHGGWDNG